MHIEMFGLEIRTTDLEYLLQNLIIEDVSCVYFVSDAFYKQKLASSLINNNETDIIEESIIFKGLKKARITFPIDIQEPFQKKIHTRMFDVINTNVETIKELEILEKRTDYNENVCYSLNLCTLLTFTPKLFERLTTLGIVFQYHTILNNLTLPNLKSLNIIYAEDDSIETSVDSPLTVGNVNMPNIQRFWGSFEPSNEDQHLLMKIIDGYTLQFGYEEIFGKIMPYPTVEWVKNKKIYSFFNTVVDFEFTKKIRRLELKNPIIELFNRMMDEKSELSFDNLEELCVSCFIYSKTDQLLNQHFADVFTHKNLYTTLKKLDIEIISGGDPIQVTTLDNGNLPALEHLCIKGSWECFNSIRGLQVISLPKLSFINLKVLKLEDVILPNFTDLDLPNVKEMHLKDVYEDEVFSGLSINGVFCSLETIELEYTDRKTILKEKVSPEFQTKMAQMISTLNDWVNLAPVITIDQTVYKGLSDLKYSKEAVTIKYN